MKALFSLDFDDTLVDTNGTLRLAQETICSKLHIDPALFERAYQEIKKSNGVFNPEKHLRMVMGGQKNLKGGIQAYEDAFAKRMPHAVFTDVGSSIKKLKMLGVVAIFSKGDADWQRKKIRWSGLDADVDYVMAVEEKSAKHIGKMASAAPMKPDIIFHFDDKPKEFVGFREYAKKTGVRVYLIRIARTELIRKVNADLADAEFDTLANAVEHVKGILK
ncbi:MAG: hypothetical protein HY366_02985 [Candidatus Aenigmarchaeota archaeon]|nr:hypothetical protein [Candidatus Aenigmarchaeota archaeon]